MIFEFLASKSFSVPIYRSLSPLELKLEPKMEFSFFCLSRQGLFLKNGIFREPLGIRCSNFQDKFVFMMVKHGEKMKKSERYGCHALDDLIWIYPEIQYICSPWIKLLSLISSYNIGSTFAKEELIHILLELLSLKQIKYDIIVRCLHNLI